MKENLCEWEDKLTYIENSRTARAISCDSVTEKKKESKEENQWDREEGGVWRRVRERKGWREGGRKGGRKGREGRK